MESFAAVVRTLLTRIRAVQARTSILPRPGMAAPPPPEASVYRVAPTTWGVVDHHGPRPAPAAEKPTRPPADRAAVDGRRGLELTVYGLPVPRGLVST